MRRALAIYPNQRAAATSAPSALDLVGDLAGCFSGGPADLSSNPRHLDDFGRSQTGGAATRYCRR